MNFNVGIIYNRFIYRPSKLIMGQVTKVIATSQSVIAYGRVPDNFEDTSASPSLSM